LHQQNSLYLTIRNNNAENIKKKKINKEQNPTSIKANQTQITKFRISSSQPHKNLKTWLYKQIKIKSSEHTHGNIETGN